MTATTDYQKEPVLGWVATDFEGTPSGDAEVWASAFAEDAVLDDPAGETAKTMPQAILKQGETFPGAFQTLGWHKSFVHAVGNEAVAKWQGRGRTSDGKDVGFEGIDHFVSNTDGKIARLRGFFSPPGA